MQPAERLMTIVPSDGGLFVETRVLNKDAGFVRAGQTVSVKVDAFPFTEYGVAPGVVDHIDADAVDDEKRGLVYVSCIRLIRTRWGRETANRHWEQAWRCRRK